MPLLLITLAISLEYLPELFKHIPFKYNVPDTSGYVFDTTWKDPIWYFMQGLFCLIASVYIFSLIPGKYPSVKLVAFESIIWWSIELYQKFCWLIKVNDDRIYVNGSSQWQIFIILSITVLLIYGLIRYKS